MNVPIEELTTVSDLKAFTQRAKELQKAQPDPLTSLVDLDAATTRRLYERFYIAAPCASFGVKATASAACYIPEDLRWRLFVRQAWAIAKDRLRAPFPAGSVHPYQTGTPEERFDYFKRACLNHDFDSALEAAAGFLSGDTDRQLFRKRSVELALGDTAHFGVKAVFLALAWSLAERGEWRQTLDCLFPALHFMVLADHERLDDAGPTVRAAEVDKSLGLEKYQETEKSLLWGSAQQASAAVDALAASGAGARQLYDALLLACAQAVINSNAGNWADPVRVFQLIFLCGGLESATGQPLRYLRTTALLLNKAARGSAETTENRPVDDVLSRVCPTDPIGVLRSVVSHSDPHASATAVLAGLGMPDDRREEVLRTLCAQAIKNDAACSCSHDILYVGQAIDTWRACQWPNRDLLPASAAYLIGRLPKNYELAAEYGV